MTNGQRGRPKLHEYQITMTAWAKVKGKDFTEVRQGLINTPLMYKWHDIRIWQPWQEIGWNLAKNLGFIIGMLMTLGMLNAFIRLTDMVQKLPDGINIIGFMALLVLILAALRIPASIANEVNHVVRGR